MSTLNLFKTDFYNRIGGLNVFRNRTVLDVGCGDGKDANEIARYARRVTGIDIELNESWKRAKKNVKFICADAEKLPFSKQSFNGIFLKDVLHHVKNPEKVIRGIKRVATKDALIFLIEGNRYNPLFYVHMTKLGGHEHLTQDNFKKLVLKHFPHARFIHFESHFIPFIGKNFFEVVILIEKIMDKIKLLRPFLSYNTAIINKQK